MSPVRSVIVRELGCDRERDERTKAEELFVPLVPYLVNLSLKLTRI